MPAHAFYFQRANADEALGPADRKFSRCFKRHDALFDYACSRRFLGAAFAVSNAPALSMIRWPPPYRRIAAAIMMMTAFRCRHHRRATRDASGGHDGALYDTSPALFSRPRGYARGHALMPPLARGAAAQLPRRRGDYAHRLFIGRQPRCLPAEGGRGRQYSLSATSRLRRAKKPLPLLRSWMADITAMPGRCQPVDAIFMPAPEDRFAQPICDARRPAGISSYFWPHSRHYHRPAPASVQFHHRPPHFSASRPTLASLSYAARIFFHRFH